MVPTPALACGTHNLWLDAACPALGCCLRRAALAAGVACPTLPHAVLCFAGIRIRYRCVLGRGVAGLNGCEGAVDAHRAVVLGWAQILLLAALAIAGANIACARTWARRTAWCRVECWT
eukprot:scaffold626_cov128-Isochrysis_galbana.AAC.2